MSSDFSPIVSPLRLAAGGRVKPRSLYPEEGGPPEAYPDWHSSLNNHRLAGADQAQDDMERRPHSVDPIEWQRTHPNPDPEIYSYSHLPSDLEQRGMLQRSPLGMARGGRFATGGNVGPFGGPGWAIGPGYVPSTLAMAAGSPQPADPLTAALSADPFAYLTNGGGAGNGSGNGAPAPSGAPSSAAPSANNGVDQAGIGVSGNLGIGPAGKIGATVIGGLMGVPAAAPIADNIVGALQANSQLSNIGAQPLGFMDVVNGIVSSVANPFGIFGKEIGLAPSMSKSAEMANNNTKAALGIGIPTSSVDFADHNAPESSTDPNATQGQSEHTSDKEAAAPGGGNGPGPGSGQGSDAPSGGENGMSKGGTKRVNGALNRARRPRLGALSRLVA